MNLNPTLLIVAKAPVPGRAKTRLAASIGDADAARIAAASLLDTLETGARLSWPTVLALTGDPQAGIAADEIASACRSVTVIGQRGNSFPARLAAAHADADTGRPIVQIGMDTPQVTPRHLQEAAAALDTFDASLGMAPDGGWWVLGVRRSAWAACLADVPMSRPDTGELTRLALRESGASVGLVADLNDVDSWEDARDVAALIPRSRFAAEVSRTAEREKSGEHR